MSLENQIRVLLVDDDLLVRETLAEYLAGSGIDVVGLCEDGPAAIAAVGELEPDVVLMDIRMPGMSGVDATRAILQEHPDIRVVALTTFDDDESIAAIFDAGGAGYLLKNTRPAALAEAIRAAHSGLSVVPPKLMSRWSPGRAVSDPPRLLPRERQVLELLTRGLTNREIARELFVSASTVKTHITALMRKLDADNRTSLTTRAHVLGLISNNQSNQL